MHELISIVYQSWSIAFIPIYHMSFYQFLPFKDSCELNTISWAYPGFERGGCPTQCIVVHSYQYIYIFSGNTQKTFFDDM